jgi:hypothetical protein
MAPMFTLGAAPLATPAAAGGSSWIGCCRMQDFASDVEDLAVEHRARADAAPFLRPGLRHPNPEVVVGCCRILDHFLYEEAVPEVLALPNALRPTSARRPFTPSRVIAENRGRVARARTTAERAELRASISGLMWFVSSDAAVCERLQRPRLGWLVAACGRPAKLVTDY